MGDCLTVICRRAEVLAWGSWCLVDRVRNCTIEHWPYWCIGTIVPDRTVSSWLSISTFSSPSDTRRLLLMRSSSGRWPVSVPLMLGQWSSKVQYRWLQTRHCTRPSQTHSSTAFQVAAFHQVCCVKLRLNFLFPSQPRDRPVSGSYVCLSNCSRWPV
jgi:hypothetical protein